jgi:hypothetical protein
MRPVPFQEFFDKLRKDDLDRETNRENTENKSQDDRTESFKP